MSYQEATSASDELRKLLSEGICLAIHDKDFKKLDEILKYAFDKCLVVFIDYKALESLVINE